MTKQDLNEALTATEEILSALLLIIKGETGAVGAALVQACGQLTANGASELETDNPLFWADLANCFETARAVGASFVAMDAVRAVAEGQTPSGLPAIAIKNFAVRMALAEEAQILALTAFASRQSIDAIFDQVNASFDLAITVAADNLDNVAYTALTSLFAAVSNDLANRARPLPRMTTYIFPARLPALLLAQRLYYDPARADELIAENKPIHPLFMPMSGAALSA